MKSILYFVVALLVIAGCSNMDENLSNKPTIEKKSNFETFSIYGKVHNEMLNDADLNFFEPETFATTKVDAINQVLSFQKESVKKLSISDSDKQFLMQGLETYKKLYCTEDLMNSFYAKTSRTVEEAEEITTEEIRTLIKDAYESGSIDSFEYKTFLQLVDYVVENASGSLSNFDFEHKVTTLINQWEIKYSDVDFSQLEAKEDNGMFLPKDFDTVPKGALGGVVLNVSQSSLKYWETPQTRAVPAFVGADIAGAVVGACLGAVGSKVVSGSVSWKGVAWSATSGAITGSTGIVGKIGKWITKCLNRL